MVSVIIPVFNAEKFIADALTSALNQTWKNIEVIIIDDGSTDASRAIIKTFEEKDNRIKYYFQKNAGCSAAKKTGLALAQGDFIQYLDADDILSEEKIETQVHAIGDQYLKLPVCKTVVFEDAANLNTGNEVNTDLLYTTNDTVDFLLNLYGVYGNHVGMIQPNAFLMHKSLAAKTGTWDTSLSPSPDEDGEYFCRAILNASGIIFTEGINYYRIIPNAYSLSKNKSLQHAKGFLRSIQLKKEHLFRFADNELTRKAIARQLGWCAYSYGIDNPEIIGMVKKEFKTLGIKRMPLPDTRLFNYLSRITGFDMAIKIKRVYNRVMRKLAVAAPIHNKPGDNNKMYKPE